MPFEFFFFLHQGQKQGAPCLCFHQTRVPRAPDLQSCQPREGPKNMVGGMQYWRYFNLTLTYQDHPNVLSPGIQHTGLRAYWYGTPWIIR